MGFRTKESDGLKPFLSHIHSPHPSLPHPLPVSETIKGKPADPLRWLEDRTLKETQSYIKAEMRYCDAMAKGFQKTLEELVVEVKGRILEDEIRPKHFYKGYEWFEKWVKGKDYPIHCRISEAGESVVLDENLLAEGNPYFDLDLFELTSCGERLAFAIDCKGDEVYQIQFKDLKTDKLLPDLIEESSGDGVWDRAGNYFFYVTADDSLREYRVMRHALGKTVSEDVVVFQEDDPTFSVSIYTSYDNAFLFIYTSSKDTSEIYYLDADCPLDAFKCLRKRKAHVDYSADYHHGKFIIKSNENAPNYRVFSTAASDLSEAPAESILLEVNLDQQITGFDCLEQAIVFYVRRKGYEKLLIFSFSDGKIHEVELPQLIGSISPADIFDHSLPYYIFHFESPLQPEITYRLDLTSYALEVIYARPLPKDIDLSLYLVERKEARAEDGTLVPITIIRNRNYSFDQQSPLYLYAYGAYGEVVEANYRNHWLSLLKRGFIIAIPHVRGGGYLGHNWYHEGKKQKKKNSFSDFITTTEFLCQQNYATSGNIVAHGESAGGLLLGVVLNQRADLFRSVVLEVPFLDALNTMLNPDLPLTTLEYEEWGNPNEIDSYEVIKSYSPYENIRAGLNHPALLVSASMNDSRVAYWEPLKWVAKLRMAKGNSNPILLKIFEDAGHAGQSGRYEYLEECCFFFSFIIASMQDDQG